MGRTAINPARDLARIELNDGNPILLPDVGIDFAIDVFEFVQLVYGSLTVNYVNRPRNLKISRVNEPDATRSVAQYQRLPISRKSPTLAGVIKLPRAFERLGIVDKTHLMLPRELVNLPVQHRDAFREVRHRHVDFFQDFATFESDTAQARMTFFARAFEQFSIH